MILVKTIFAGRSYGFIVCPNMGITVPDFNRYCVFVKEEKKVELSIKIYLTKQNFRYISISRVVRSGKRWYGALVRG